MSLPSCFSLLNEQVFANLQVQIGNCTTELELQALADQIMADISLLQSTLTSQIAFLGPIEALLTAPEANPAAIVTWITSLINDVLTPLLKPYVIMAEQLAALTAIIATLTTALENAAASLGVSITIPTPRINCTL